MIMNEKIMKFKNYIISIIIIIIAKKSIKASPDNASILKETRFLSPCMNPPYRMADILKMRKIDAQNTINHSEQVFWTEWLFEFKSNGSLL